MLSQKALNLIEETEIKLSNEDYIENKIRLDCYLRGMKKNV